MFIFHFVKTEIQTLITDGKTKNYVFYPISLCISLVNRAADDSLYGRLVDIRLISFSFFYLLNTDDTQMTQHLTELMRTSSLIVLVLRMVLDCSIFESVELN